MSVRSANNIKNSSYLFQSSQIQQPQPNKIGEPQQNKNLKYQKNRLDKIYQYPATTIKARMHKKANKFGYYNKDKPGVVCPCCQLPINPFRIKLKYNTTPTKEQVTNKNTFLLNSGTAMFFTFIKMTILYLFLKFIITDCYNIITNIIENSCNRFDDQINCKGNFITKLSSYNKKSSKDEQMIFNLDILNLATVLLSIVFFTYYRRYQYEVYCLSIISNNSQANYSIFVQNIPIILFYPSFKMQKSIFRQLQILFQEQLDQWMKQVSQKKDTSNNLNKSLHKLIENKPSIKKTKKVMSISLCFDLTQIDKLNQLRKDLMKKHKQNIDNQVIQNLQSNSCILNQIKYLDKQFFRLSESFAFNKYLQFHCSHFLGKAFITFQYQHYQKYILQKFENQQTLYFFERPIKISAASQPSDVYWFNMHISNDNRIKQILYSYIIMLLSLFLSFILLFYIQEYKQKMASFHQEMNTGKQPFFRYFFTFIMTTLITLINYIIAIIIQTLTEKEKHQTKTNHIFSLIVKTVIAHFLNTAILYYIVSLGSSHNQPLQDHELALTITSLIALSGFIQILLNALQFPTVFKNITNWYKYGFKQKVNLFQIQLNHELQSPQFKFCQQYAYYIVNIYIVSFYSYLTPYVGIILALIFCIQYWVDKYNLFFRCFLPTDFDFRLSKFTFQAFEYTIVIFALGNLLFSINIHKQQIILNWISLGLALTYCIAIFLIPTKYLQNLDQYDYHQMPYSSLLTHNQFNKAYWLSNPATAFVKEVNINYQGYFVNYQFRQQFGNQLAFQDVMETEIYSQNDQDYDQYKRQPLTFFVYKRKK